MLHSLGKDPCVREGRRPLRLRSLPIVRSVGMETLRERLEAIAAHSKGFVSAISRVGITGTQQSLTGDAESLVARIRRWSGLPVAVGFGISNSEHVAQVGKFADAAVVGSAIVELIEKSTPEAAPDAVARFIKGLRLPQAALAR